MHEPNLRNCIIVIKTISIMKLSMSCYQNGSIKSTRDTKYGCKQDKNHAGFCP
jgi:hypothetical protein